MWDHYVAAWSCLCCEVKQFQTPASPGNVAHSCSEQLFSTASWTASFCVLNRERHNRWSPWLGWTIHREAPEFSQVFCFLEACPLRISKAIVYTLPCTIYFAFVWALGENCLDEFSFLVLLCLLIGDCNPKHCYSDAFLSSVPKHNVKRIAIWHKNVLFSLLCFAASGAYLKNGGRMHHDSKRTYEHTTQMLTIKCNMQGGVKLKGGS